MADCWTWGDAFSSDDESLENLNDSTEANENLESFGAVRSDDDDDEDEDEDEEDDDEEERHLGSPQFQSLEEIAEMSDDDDFVDNGDGGRRRRRGLNKDLTERAARSMLGEWTTVCECDAGDFRPLPPASQPK